MKQTLYATLIQACGLSHQAAADFHQVRRDTVKSWSSGRRTAHPDIYRALWDLRHAQLRAARMAADEFHRAEKPPGEAVEIEIGIAADDAEAQSLGWPCVGAQMAMVADLWAMLDPAEARLTLVPRGSTLASAAAADEHERILK